MIVILAMISLSLFQFPVPVSATADQRREPGGEKTKQPGEGEGGDPAVPGQSLLPLRHPLQCEKCQELQENHQAGLPGSGAGGEERGGTIGESASCVPEHLGILLQVRCWYCLW